MKILVTGFTGVTGTVMLVTGFTGVTGTLFIRAVLAGACRRLEAARATVPDEQACAGYPAAGDAAATAIGTGPAG